MAKKLDEKNINHGLVITGLLQMVEDDGLTPREAFEVLEDIKRNTYSALTEVYHEKWGKKA